jgi:hypothetical protein
MKSAGFFVCESTDSYLSRLATVMACGPAHRPLVADHAIEVDQSRHAVGSAVEHVTFVDPAGVVVRHTVELNEGHAKGLTGADNSVRGLRSR